MSTQPNTLKLHRLLAASYPEPIDHADLVRRLSLPARALDRAISHCVANGSVRRVRRLCACKGYAYTVAV